jgi:hypothetical protein
MDPVFPTSVVSSINIQGADILRRYFGTPISEGAGHDP